MGMGLEGVQEGPAIAPLKQVEFLNNNRLSRMDNVHNLGGPLNLDKNGEQKDLGSPAYIVTISKEAHKLYKDLMAKDNPYTGVDNGV